MAAEAQPTLANQAWGRVVSVYNSAGTRATSLAAGRLISLATQIKPMDKNSYILDLGAGAGATTIETARFSPSSAILATDISENMVRFVADLNIPNVSTQVLNAANADSLGRGVFSHVLSTFMLQFMLEPEAVVSGAYKVLRPGGVIGLGLWYEDSDFIVPWEKACQKFDPNYQTSNKFIDPNAWTSAEDVKYHLSTTGFTDIEVSDMYVPFDFANAEAFVNFVCHGNVPSVDHIVSQWKGDRQKVSEVLTEIVRHDYGNGKDLRLHALLAVARKPLDD